ncbi:D-arabitol-phosphate dehydrogenase [Peptococcaceae bacterium CEB3]|nr:D-arabitol-phosphate dehydrogenase [Peptococcaceae bacterium CEB3]
MKAVVKYANQDGCTEIRDMAVPEIGPDDVLVEVAYIGICGSDPHIHHQDVSYPIAVPLVLGHEFSGIIAKVGSNVRDWVAGERVTAETHARYCGKCAMCRTNRYHLCRERKGFGFGVDGAFAKYVSVPSRILHKVPDNVSLRDASLTEPLCVAYNALVKYSRINPGDFVVIIGPGPIGLLCTTVAKLQGAGEIIVVGSDGDEERLAKALELGATKAVQSSKQNIAELVMSIGDAYGADLVVDTAGPSATLKLALEIVRPAGQITKIGWGPEPVNFSLDQLIAKSARLQGCFSHTWDVWEKCLTLMAEGQVDLSKLITHELPIEDWKRGFEVIEKSQGIKVVLVP